MWFNKFVWLNILPWKLQTIETTVHVKFLTPSTSVLSHEAANAAFEVSYIILQFVHIWTELL